MKTLRNRILSGVMAGVLTMALAVPAFAADPETTITSTYAATTIDVVVPATGTATINPYGLPIDVTKSDGTTKVSFTNQKIMTQPTAAIMNKMGIDLNVNVSVTGAVTALPSSSTATPMRLATEALTADATTKSVFAYVQAKTSTQTGAADTASVHTIADALIVEYAAWTQAYDADKDVIVKAGTETKENFIQLKAAKMDATSGAFDEFKAGSIAMIRLAGDAVTSPREAWTTDDQFTAKITYTFLPVAAASNP